MAVRPDERFLLWRCGMRVALIALACVLALSTLVSTVAVAELHDHDCTGDDCPTCLVLEISQAVLSLVASGSPTALLASSLAFAFVADAVASGLFLSVETPVSLKVRLVI